MPLTSAVREYSGPQLAAQGHLSAALRRSRRRAPGARWRPARECPSLGGRGTGRGGSVRATHRRAGREARGGTEVPLRLKILLRGTRRASGCPRNRWGGCPSTVHGKPDVPGQRRSGGWLARTLPRSDAQRRATARRSRCVECPARPEFDLPRGGWVGLALLRRGSRVGRRPEGEPPRAGARMPCARPPGDGRRREAPLRAPPCGDRRRTVCVMPVPPPPRTASTYVAAPGVRGASPRGGRCGRDPGAAAGPPCR